MTPPKSSKASSSQAGAAAGQRVLLADDDPVSRFATRRFLQKTGYEVDEVSGGLAAVDAASRQPYGFIFMDCEMPVVDGLEAARRIRADEARCGASRVPIIALTAHTQLDAGGACIAAGMDACLTKPLDRQNFCQVMERLLGSAPSVAHAPADFAPEGVVVAAAPFDTDAVLHRCLNDAHFVEGILEQFRSQATGQFEQLSRCLEARSATAVAQEAHRLRGSAAHLSAADLAKACETMELHAKAGDVAAAARCLSEVEAQLRHCLDYLPQAVEDLHRRSRAAST
jgi:CheY-like chemotaxis protein